MWIRHKKCDGSVVLVNIDHVSRIETYEYKHDKIFIILIQQKGFDPLSMSCDSEEDRDAALEEMWNHLRDK